MLKTCKSFGRSCVRAGPPTWLRNHKAIPFPNYQTKLYSEFMNNVEDKKGQRSLSVPEFICTHEGKCHLFTLFFRTSTNSVSSSVLAHSSWASKAKLNTCRYQKTNCRFKETIIYGCQLSTTLIQINFQTRSWLWGAPLPVSHTQRGLRTNNCQKEGMKVQGWWGRCEMFDITANVQ